MISGTLYLATGEALDRDSAKKLPAGSFGYWPAGMKHTAWSEGETVIQLHGIDPWQINYLNPANDPRKVRDPHRLIGQTNDGSAISASTVRSLAPLGMTSQQLVS